MHLKRTLLSWNSATEIDRIRGSVKDSNGNDPSIRMIILGDSQDLKMMSRTMSRATENVLMVCIRVGLAILEG
jgi:hypothetical protein